jgi:hypothetical protein
MAASTWSNWKSNGASRVARFTVIPGCSARNPGRRGANQREGRQDRRIEAAAGGTGAQTEGRRADAAQGLADLLGIGLARRREALGAEGVEQGHGWQVAARNRQDRLSGADPTETPCALDAAGMA